VSPARPPEGARTAARQGEGHPVTARRALAHTSPRSHQRGFSSALVLIVIVLLSSLLAYAVTLTSSAHSGLALEIATARALQAARGGLEWGRFRITNGAAPSCAASTTLALPLSTGAFPVTVRCTETLPAFNEAGTTVRIFQLTATACSPAPSGSCPDATPSGDYVQQQVSGIAQR
jgi:Tfp pilus assembly protein PilX